MTQTSPRKLAKKRLLKQFTSWKMVQITCLQARNRNAYVEKEHMDPSGEGEGGMNWEIRIAMQTLPCVNIQLVGTVLFSTESSAWYYVMTQMGGMGCRMGGRSKREEICVYIQLIHFFVQQNLTQYCKAIVLQPIKKKKKEFTVCSNQHVRIGGGVGT